MSEEFKSENKLIIELFKWFSRNISGFQFLRTPNFLLKANFLVNLNSRNSSGAEQ